MSFAKENFISTYIYDLAKDPVVTGHNVIGDEILKYIEICKQIGLINLCYQNSYIPTVVYDFDDTLHHLFTNTYYDDIFDTVVNCIDNNIFVYILSYSGTARTPKMIEIMDKWFISKNKGITCTDLINQKKMSIKPIGPASMMYRHFDDADLYNQCTGKKCAIRYKLYNNTNYIILANIGDKYRDSEPYTSGTINQPQQIRPVDLIEQDLKSVLYNGKIFKIISIDDISEIDKVRDMMNIRYAPVLNHKIKDTIDQYIDYLADQIQQNIGGDERTTYGYIETLKRDMDQQCLSIKNKNPNCGKFIKPLSYDRFVGDVAESYLP